MEDHGSVAKAINNVTTTICMGARGSDRGHRPSVPNGEGGQSSGTRRRNSATPHTTRASASQTHDHCAFWVWSGVSGSPVASGPQPGRFQGPGQKHKTRICCCRCYPIRSGLCAGRPGGTFQGTGPPGRVIPLGVGSGGFSGLLLLPGKVTALRATLTGREGRVVCWKHLLLAARPARAARTHNATSIHRNCGLLCNVVVYVSTCESKQRARKPLLRGFWGVNPENSWGGWSGTTCDASV